MLSEQNVVTLAKPFDLAEHGFKNGNPYIRKSAIRRRLSKVDLLWTISAPEFVALAGDDVVIYRGSITVHGVTRWGLGSGIIQRTDADKKALEGYGLAKNIAKAHKEAATDILARAAVEFGVGNYLKDKPADIKQAGFKDWLDKLSGSTPAPVTQSPPRTEPPARKPWADKAEIDDMLAKATAALGLTWLDISLFTGIGSRDDYDAWNATFEDRAAARDAIKAGHEKAMTNLTPAKPKAETAAQPA